jgi:hypothetical protein
MLIEARKWMQAFTGFQEFDFTDYQQHTELVLQGIEQISTYGPELLLGGIFNR